MYNRSFEDVSELKYFETTQTYKNFINGNINSIFNFENVSYRLVHDSSSRLID
jgi:hypothetical protein